MKHIFKTEEFMQALHSSLLTCHETLVNQLEPTCFTDYYKKIQFEASDPLLGRFRIKFQTNPEREKLPTEPKNKFELFGHYDGIPVGAVVYSDELLPHSANCTMQLYDAHDFLEANLVGKCVYSFGPEGLEIKS